MQLRLAAALAVLALGLSGAAPGPIAYPEGFRQWTHVTSSVVGPANPAGARHVGIHAIYANGKAMRGYRTGRWPDGAILVFDKWATEAAPGDTAVAATRKFVDVMVRDTRRFGATGGWGYAEFEGAGRRRVSVIEDDPTVCDTCHRDQAPGQDRVFTSWRE